MPPPPPRSAPAPAPEIVEVRCAGCGETLEVEVGLTEFICPDCAMPQALPPELMPPRRRRALPLPHGVADARGARLPCAACGAVLSVPHGLGRFACPLCGVELAVDRTLLRQYLASSAVSVVAPSAAVLLTSPPEVQEAPPSQAIRVGQVQVEPYNQPSSVEQAQVEHPNRANYLGRAQLEPCNHSSHREEAHVELLNESISRTSRKKTRFPVGPESIHVEKVQVNPPNQVIHAPPAQGGPANCSVHTDQAQVQRHSGAIARHGKQKTGCAVEASAIYIEQEQIEPPNQVVHVQQAKETPSDEIHAEQVQIEPRDKTNGGNQKRKKSTKSTEGNQKRKKKGLMSSSNEGLHLRRSKRLAKESVSLIDTEPIQQQAASTDRTLSHPPDIERIIANLRHSSLPQQQIPQASNESGNLGLTAPTTSNPGISQAGGFPHCHSPLYPPEARGTVTKPSSDSLHEHQMPQASSSETCRLDVTELQVRTNSQQTQPPQRPSGLNAGNGHLHMEREQVEPPNQVIHGQQAQELSSDENHSEQVQVDSHSKNIAAHHKQKKKGLMGSSNQGSHVGDRSFSATRRWMTLAAACSHFTTSLPLPTSNSLPTTTLPSALTTPPLYCRRLSPPHSQRPSHLHSQVYIPLPLSISGTRRSSRRRRQSGPAQVATASSSGILPMCRPDFATAPSAGHPLPVRTNFFRYCRSSSRGSGRDEGCSGSGRDEGTSGLGNQSIRKYTPRGPTTMGRSKKRSKKGDERVMIRPAGEDQWYEMPYNRKDHRTTASILGAAIKREYPGVIVDKDGVRQPASTWAHYKYHKNNKVKTAADKVIAHFWERFKLWPEADSLEANRVLERNCTKRVKQMIYQARVDAVKQFHFNTCRVSMKDPEARLIHLDYPEYLSVQPPWASDEAWDLLSRWWCTDEYRETNKKHREARLSRGGAVNKGGSRSFVATQQWLEQEYGLEKAGTLDTYIWMHKGDARSEDEGQLCSQRATERVNAYYAGMQQAYPDDWQAHAFDPVVMYESTGGMKHGRLAIADGAFKKSEILSAAKSKQVGSSSSVKRGFRQECEELRQKNNSLQTQVNFMREQMQQQQDLFRDMYKRMGWPLPPIVIPQQPSDQRTDGPSTGHCGSKAGYGDQCSHNGDDGDHAQDL